MSESRDEPEGAVEASEATEDAPPANGAQRRQAEGRAAGPADAEPSADEPASADADVPAEPTAEDLAAASHKPRRVRRTRQVEPAEVPTEDVPADKPAKPASRPTRERRRAAERPRERGRPRSKDRGAVAAVMQTTDRKIFRQDTLGPADERPSPGPDEKTRPAKPAPPPKPSDKDQVTLILHPAPKAVPNRRKKKSKAPKTAKEALREKTAKQRKKDKRDEERAVELEPAWKTVGADGAVEALQKAGAGAEKLVKSWLDEDNNQAIIAAARSDEVHGKGRKAARRALGVLKSRGVDIPEPAPKAPPVAAADTPDAPVASFIPPDATGTSFISISQRQPGGRYHVADAVVRQGAGVIQVTSGRIAGKQIRNWRNRVEEQFGAAPAEIPLDWARYRIGEARKQNDLSGQIVPLGYDSAADMFGPAPAEEPPHPLADLEEEAQKEQVVEKAVLDSESLHVEPEFRSWLPERSALDELLRKVGEKVGPSQADDPKAVDEALEEELAAAVDRYFTPELRKELRSRIRDAAISLRSRKGDDAARKALAVGKAVEEAGLITAPPNQIPFLKTFFQKAVAMMLRQNQGQLRVPMPPKP